MKNISIYLTFIKNTNTCICSIKCRRCSRRNRSGHCSCRDHHPTSQSTHSCHWCPCTAIFTRRNRRWRCICWCHHSSSRTTRYCRSTGPWTAIVYARRNRWHWCRSWRSQKSQLAKHQRPNPCSAKWCAPVGNAGMVVVAIADVTIRSHVTCTVVVDRVRRS